MIKKYFVNNQGRWSFWKTVRNLLVIILLCLAAIAGKVYSDVGLTLTSLNQTEDDRPEQTQVVHKFKEVKKDLEKGEPINVLLVGTDADETERTRENGFVSRSDTLMLMTLNPEKKESKILSIPRDTLAEIDKDHPADKINHAFAYGGIDLTEATVENFLNIPIDYYAVINMSGLEEVIDALGGIEVTSPLTFEYRGTQFKKGETREVNGIKAMNFARMRHEDPEGEVGREERQKIVVEAIIDKVLSFDSVWNYQGILDVVARNVKTNLDMSKAFDLLKMYTPALEDIQRIKFKDLEEAYIDNIFYFRISIEDRMRISNEMRQLLNLPLTKKSDLIEPEEGDIEKAAEVIQNFEEEYGTTMSPNSRPDRQLDRSQGRDTPLRPSYPREEREPSYSNQGSSPGSYTQPEREEDNYVPGNDYTEEGPSQPAAPSPPSSPEGPAEPDTNYVDYTGNGEN